MKLSVLPHLFKRPALVLALACAPVLASAGTLHHNEPAHAGPTTQRPTMVSTLGDSQALSNHRMLQLSMNTSLRDSIDEVVHQASLVRTAYRQLGAALASGDERETAATRARLAGHQVAFLKAQQNVRANLVQMRAENGRSEAGLN